MKIIQNLLLFAYFVLTVCGLRVPHREVASKPHIIWNNKNDHGDGLDQRIDTRSKRSQFECGVHGQESTIDSLSEETLPGEWPWVVAIFTSNDKRLDFSGAGSLIDNRFVITVATNVHDVVSKKQYELEELAIVVGARDVTHRTYDEGNIRFLTAMYTYKRHRNFTNNIVLLVLKKPVTYSKLVRPVCMWEGEDDQDDLEKAIQYGTVVGWDYSYKFNRLLAPHRFNVSIKSCLELLGDRASELTNEKNICTRFTESLTAAMNSTEMHCRVSSGSGLYIEQHGRWMLRGLVDRFTHAVSTCDEIYINFDVAEYRNWISETMYHWSQESQFECGVHGQEPTIDSLSAETLLGEWPWVVAVFISSDNGLVYNCGGSLIDNGFVITDASCVYNRTTEKQLEIEEIAIIVGAKDVSYQTYDEGNIRFLTAMYTYENISGYSTTKNNIALLVLKKTVTYSQLVRPVCMWEGEDDHVDLEKAIQHGTVVGWDNKSKDGLLSPHRYNVSIKSCQVLLGYRLSVTNTNEKNICTRFTESLSAATKATEMHCGVDSGSGLYIKQHGSWMLRGLVLRATKPVNTCDAIYTNIDVAKYRNWISETVYRWSQGDSLPSTLSISTSTEKNIAWTQQCSKRDEINTLITGGQSTKKGEWPWHVAIYHIEHMASSSSISYKCGGSLISASHVLTAAHCFINKVTNRPISKHNINIYLGTHSIKSFSEGVQLKLVDRLKIHPEYKSETQYKDIAVLKLNSPVEVTLTIRPVCLWPEDEVDLSNVVGKNGSVVGWGNDEFGVLADELMLAEMSVVSEVTCIRSHDLFYQKYTNNFTFCAGLLQDKSACNGDSGGGMVFKLRSSAGTEVWFLRGLISLRLATDKRCDPSQYVIFTDVAKHLDWIKDSVSRD